MPATHDHSTLAARNAKALEYIKARIDDFPEWVVTIAFYEALHSIEAAMACDPTIQRSISHKERNSLIRQDSGYKSVWRSYKSLYDTSCIARYMDDGEINFSTYMSRAEIENTVIGEWLHHVKAFAASKIEKAQQRAEKAKAASKPAPSKPAAPAGN